MLRFRSRPGAAGCRGSLRACWLLLALALAACDTVEVPGQTAARPPSTPRPTWTPLPATPEPSPTPVPALPDQSSAEIGELLRGAVAHTTAIERYRLEFSLAAKSYERRRSAQAPEAKLVAQIDLDQKEPLMTVTGEYSGDSSRTTTIYHCVDCDEGEQDKTFDILASDGALYMWLEEDKTWYLVDRSLAADALPALEGHSLLGHMLDTRVDLTSFQASQNTRLDELACTVYADYSRAAISALVGMSQSFGENEDALFEEAVNSVQADESVLRVTLCEDNNIHRIALDISGYLKEDQSQAFALSYNLRLYDVDAEIAINTPRGAVALDFGDYDYGEDELTAEVFNGGNIRAEPSTSGQVLGQVEAGETVYLYEKSADGRWYYVWAEAAEGWVHSSLLAVEPAVAAQVPIAGQEQLASGELTASVFNGGNVRAEPSTSGQVLDQINAGEAVELLGRSADGVWYQIRNIRGVIGWVHSSLLTIEPGVSERVPVI
jgi:SH3-like domain-containing protein